jgi:hypothetical protein
MNDIWHHVFTFLNGNDRAKICTVNKQYLQIALGFTFQPAQIEQIILYNDIHSLQRIYNLRQKIHIPRIYGHHVREWTSREPRVRDILFAVSHPFVEANKQVTHLFHLYNYSLTMAKCLVSSCLTTQHHMYELCSQYERILDYNLISFADRTTCLDLSLPFVIS